MGRSLFVGIALLVAFISFLLVSFFPSKLTLHLPLSPPSISTRLFTVQELAVYNGTDDALPILLAILGSVFDVTKGRSHYGVGGGYNHFAGRDASRAFVSGNFSVSVKNEDSPPNKRKVLRYLKLRNTGRTCSYGHVLDMVIRDGLTDSLRGLSSPEVKSVVDWRDFYVRTYISVGKLVGLYYDSEGNTTKYLKGVEAKAARGAQLMEKQKNEEAKLPSCNSRWSQEEGSEVWCDDGYPRLVQRPLEIALTGKMSKQCACFNKDELGQPGLEVYEGCEYFAKLCRL